MDITTSQIQNLDFQRQLAYGGTCVDTNFESESGIYYDCDDYTYYSYSTYDCDYGENFYDDEDFIGKHMCCQCGGGVTDDNLKGLSCLDTDNGATDIYGFDCEDRTNGSVVCSQTWLNDGDFNSSDMCCACGGGEFICEDLDVQPIWDSLSFSCSQYDWDSS